MNVLIFGAGAMGSVFGGFLSQEHSLTLIGREPHMRAIAERGLRISGIWGEHRFTRLKALTSVEQISEQERFDLIMITTKSYDTAKAVEEVAPLVGEETAVLSMQNGIGNEEVIARAFGERRTLGGMAIFGARLVEPGHAEVTVYASECLVGELEGGASERAGKIAAAFSRAGIPTKASDDIIRDKWLKAFYNIALNPLSAILRVPYGKLGEMQETLSIMRAMLREAFEVAKALGIRVGYTWEEYYEHLLRDLLPPTARHISSMLQDMERGKRTEIDYLNGAVVRLGRELGIATPVNETVTEIVKALERRHRGAGA
ncbi:MAG: ketopantoate reductase family protein [Euryarchaeota archaeon]|nr:ketopantoate reductase family protein [Euryarchaeota archaeon]